MQAPFDLNTPHTPPRHCTPYLPRIPPHAPLRKAVWVPGSLVCHRQTPAAARRLAVLPTHIGRGAAPVAPTVKDFPPITTPNESLASFPEKM